MARGDRDSAAARRALVDYLRGEGALTSQRVADALLAIPRELFVPGLPLDEVYRPADAIITKRLDGVGVSSASAPEVIALMLEQLDPRPGDCVLEIGAGTGYNAALLAQLVGPTGRVVTIDIDDDIVEAAREHVDAAGVGDRVTVVCSDGALGYPGMTFDRIILTVAADDLAPAWREQLARPHGRLVLPLAFGGPQRCVTFVPANDHFEAHAVRNCSFISLRGAMAMSGGSTGPIELEHMPPVRRFWPTGVSAHRWETSGLHLWLAVHQANVYAVWPREREPGESSARSSLCILDSESLVMLGRADASDELVIATPGEWTPLADRVLTLLRDWEAASRPTDADLQVRAYERGHAPPLQPAEVRIDQRGTTFVLRWVLRS